MGDTQKDEQHSPAKAALPDQTHHGFDALTVSADREKHKSAAHQIRSPWMEDLKYVFFF